jgi:DegV family protein with EDD domain
VAVKIVVDSTSDIDAGRAAKYDITVVPLTVSFGDKDYQDGVDLDNKTFYEKLVSNPVVPKTSTPSVGLFESAYRAAIKAGATGILSVHISGALSGTLNTASIAANTVQTETGIPIKAFDSRTVSAGFGLPAMRAAERAAKGESLDDLVAYVQRAVQDSKTYFVLDTLEYLEKGGRIGRAKAVFGAMLKIKPILCIKDGEVAALENARTRSKALTRVAELVRAAGNINCMALAASDDATDAEMTEAVKQVYQGTIEHFKLGAVIGTYAGPRAAGLFVSPNC